MKWSEYLIISQHISLFTILFACKFCVNPIGIQHAVHLHHAQFQFSFLFTVLLFSTFCVWVCVSVAVLLRQIERERERDRERSPREKWPSAFYHIIFTWIVLHDLHSWCIYSINSSLDLAIAAISLGTSIPFTLTSKYLSSLCRVPLFYTFNGSFGSGVMRTQSKAFSRAMCIVQCTVCTDDCSGICSRWTVQSNNNNKISEWLNWTKKRLLRLLLRV